MDHQLRAEMIEKLDDLSPSMPQQFLNQHRKAYKLHFSEIVHDES